MNIVDAIRTIGSKNSKTYYQLTTLWGEALDPEHVLEEYPRPQMRRDNYINLNGYWSYAITTDGKEPTHYDGMILVPFSPESYLSGVNRQVKPNEFLHYERSLVIESKPEQMRCLLHFGAVDQVCEVFINEQKVKEHVGGYLPFFVDITEHVRLGENLIRVKVRDYSDTSYHSRGKQRLKAGGMYYTAQSGIWQTVWMEWVPEIYIDSLKITPYYDEKKIRIEVILNPKGWETSNQFLIQLEIYEQNKKIIYQEGYDNVLEIELDEMIPWSPENPFLYDIILRVGKDKVSSYFAFRKFDIQYDQEKIPRIYLNNKPYFQNGILDQGYWPDGLYTAPSDEALMYDIKKAKELGFNMIRKHIKIEPLRWYYHCDRMGMIVWQDMVNGGEKDNKYFLTYFPTMFPAMAKYISDSHYGLFGRKNPIGREQWISECKETVELLYNHPCIACWVPFNEGWGQFDSLKIVDMIRELDQSRLIDHASGWFDQKGGDFESVHNYFRKLKLQKKGRPEILSEYGGYACLVQGNSYSTQEYGYKKFDSLENLNQAVHNLINKEVRSLAKEGLSAAVYTQLSDVEEEVNGLLTYDRKICKITSLHAAEMEK